MSVGARAARPALSPPLPSCCSLPAPGLQVQAWWEGVSRSPWPLGLRTPASIIGEPQFPQDPHDEDRGTSPPFLQKLGALAHPEVRGLLKVALSELLPSLLAVSPGAGRLICAPSPNL